MPAKPSFPVRVRVALSLLAALLAAVCIDAWFRFWVMPRTRRDPRRRIEAINEGVRTWGRALFGAARWGTRVRVEVEGRIPTEGRYIVVANHQSSLDIPLLITTLRHLNLKFVAKEELRHGNPAISLALRHGGFATVDRSSMGHGLANLARFASELPKYDGSPVIFPSAGVESDQDVLQYRPAGIEVVRRIAGLPILPVAIEGFQDAPSVGELANVWRGTIKVRIFDPIPADTAEPDPRALYADLEQQIFGHVHRRRAALGVAASAASV